MHARDWGAPRRRGCWLAARAGCSGDACTHAGRSPRRCWLAARAGRSWQGAGRAHVRAGLPWRRCWARTRAGRSWQGAGRAHVRAGRFPRRCWARAHAGRSCGRLQSRAADCNLVRPIARRGSSHLQQSVQRRAQEDGHVDDDGAARGLWVCGA
eukprot:3482957-Prymnesium_polylepis.1